MQPVVRPLRVGLRVQRVGPQPGDHRLLGGGTGQPTALRAAQIGHVRLGGDPQSHLADHGVWGLDGHPADQAEVDVDDPFVVELDKQVLAHRAGPVDRVAVEQQGLGREPPLGAGDRDPPAREGGGQLIGEPVQDVALRHRTPPVSVPGCRHRSVTPD
ncbi:hypothetical protein SDC9_208523 [bioreactor metagenome]|uniref:Uncharacterized protein n=1 Tax=bioreactor metagenome TaxID=1076179 RepID=A0A645JAZ8_9ZZZZ